MDAHPDLPAVPVAQAVDIDAVLAYLPRLYPDGVAISTYVVLENAHYPTYHAVVSDFYDLLRMPCWMEVDYLAKGAGHMLETPSLTAQADLAGLRAMFTYCLRGERFCDGHWASMIEKGYVMNLLHRLKVVREQMYPDQPISEIDLISRSADGRYRVEVVVWEAGPSQWVHSPRVVDTLAGSCVFRFEDARWSAEQASWLSPTRVRLQLRKYPGQPLAEGLWVDIECGQQVAHWGEGGEVGLADLESMLDRMLEKLGE
ncbi:DUF6508 domain-containing protein [Pseudomonas sp. Teo4]|uniref:DUF6508 domain-containing protein n=1 Tax=Pseudomonas sp. Teo4 TaxID=3064528 RepID=UPI002ACB139A|nr:DUF6508 domain-containing protein [Pseudomonas sp. Teo4]